MFFHSLFIYANYAGNNSRSSGIVWPNFQIVQLIVVNMQILFVDHVCFETYFKDVNLITFDTIICFVSPFPTFTLNFGCNRQQPIPWFGNFHSIQCPISASCLATTLQALTNFLYIQFLSTCIYIVIIVTVQSQGLWW